MYFSFHVCVFSLYPIGITSSTVGLTIYTIPAAIKKHKSTIRKKKKKHNKIVLLAKFKLNSKEVVISKALNDSVIHDECLLINNVLKEYNGMKEKIKNLKA